MTTFIFWLIFIQISIFLVSGILLGLSVYFGCREKQPAMVKYFSRRPTARKPSPRFIFTL